MIKQTEDENEELRVRGVVGKTKKKCKKMKKKVVSKGKGRGKVGRERRVKGIVGGYKVGR